MTIVPFVIRCRTIGATCSGNMAIAANVAGRVSRCNPWDGDDVGWAPLPINRMAPVALIGWRVYAAGCDITGSPPPNFQIFREWSQAPNASGCLDVRLNFWTD